MLSRVSPVWLVIIGIGSVQLGAGIAKNLFDDAAPTTLVWLRISAGEVLRRVDQRGAGRDLAKLRGDWSAGLDLEPPAVPHLEVDALLSPAAMAEAVLSSLTREPGDRGS